MSVLLMGVGVGGIIIIIISLRKDQPDEIST